MNPNVNTVSNKNSKPHFWRTDVRSTKIVDLGISLLDQFGAEYAAGFLKENGISFNVAIRVLAHPMQRRKFDQPAIADI
ncbi:MAG: hypothetical protein ACRYGK_06425 [Janthinobacterium lividum]